MTSVWDALKDTLAMAENLKPRAFRLLNWQQKALQP